MKRYKYRNKYKKERSERVGFVTALSVCVIAIGLAIGSTYASIGGLEGNLSGFGGSDYTATAGNGSQEVDFDVEGIMVEGREAEETSTSYTEVPTTVAEGVTDPQVTQLPEPDVPDTKEERLQTILQVNSSLLYPVESKRVTKEYSEQAVYSETMDDYRPHTGADFSADEGDAVFSVCEGIVDTISKDDMFGNIVKITNGVYSVYYCGVKDEIAVNEGDAVSAGQVIAQVGEVPCEGDDEPHIHMEVRVNGNSIDPMTVISNDR